MAVDSSLTLEVNQIRGPERVNPGVVHTTFHNPATGTNVVTTEYVDWATNCPEYKMTAVQVVPATHRSNWQDGFDQRAEKQSKLAERIS